MKAEYWLERWREGRTGWHRDTVMPLLQQHWPSLKLPVGTKVLVPFCGKTLDMIWLAEQEFRVLGVEISPLAIERFFAENDLRATTQQTANGTCHRVGDIEIIEGDLFAVDDETLASCDAIYDRAALIALPEDERKPYARDIYGKLPSGCRGLMITLEYLQAEMEGPPFSVQEPEVRQLLADWEITLAQRREILGEQPGFQEAGLTSLHTAVHRLRRR